MRRNQPDVLGVSEMCWVGKGELQSDGFLVIYSGDSAVRKNDVGFILNSKVKNFVVKVKCFSDQVLMVRLRGEEKDLVIIQVYMLTSQHPEEEIDERYEIIEEEKKRACVMVMGEWNAVVGEGHYRNIVGKYGLGKRNDRSTKLIEICERNGLVIGNTISQHYKRR